MPVDPGRALAGDAGAFVELIERDPLIEKSAEAERKRPVAEVGVRSLERLADRVTTRNDDGAITRVLTNSAEHGVLDQKDYFDRDIATAGKVSGYYVVERGDFFYNPRTSTIAPVGPICPPSKRAAA